MNQRQRDVVVIKAWESEHGRAYDSKSIWDFAMKMEENISPVSYGDYEITRPPWLSETNCSEITHFLAMNKDDARAEEFVYVFVEECAKRSGYSINLSEAEDIVMKFFKNDSK